jgi:hypothetical protein
LKIDFSYSSAENSSPTGNASFRKWSWRHEDLHRYAALHGQLATVAIPYRCPRTHHHRYATSLVTRNRIALDTGTYGSGHLTTLIIDPVSDSPEFPWTSQSDSEITVEIIEPDVTDVPEGLQGHFKRNDAPQSAR